jgi:hypothetical protein
MRPTRRGAFLAVAGVLLTAPLALAQPSSRIVPGLSVGGVKLGMTPGQVRQVWGPPSRVLRPEASIEAWQYDQYRSTVFIGLGEVYIIQTNSPRFATPEGIKVGTVLASVLKVYGQPECQHAFAGGLVLSYARRGLLIRVVNGVVRALSVFQPPGRCE